MTLQQFIAAIVFALCLALLVHHFLGARRQACLRQWGQARLWQMRRWVNRVRQRRRSRNATPDQAAREAADLIARAKRRGGRGPDGAGNGADKSAGKGAGNGAGKPAADGANRSDNVIRPPRFGNRRNDLH